LGWPTKQNIWNSLIELGGIFAVWAINTNKDES
jgi:hypothetical protein